MSRLSELEGVPSVPVYGRGAKPRVDDPELAAALYKIFPEADTWVPLGRVLLARIAEHLPDRSPVMVLGVGAELGYLAQHPEPRFGGVCRLDRCWMPARLLAGGRVDPRLESAKLIEGAAKRIPGIVEKLEASRAEVPSPLRVAYPAGDAYRAVVTFTRAGARWLFSSIETR